MTPFALRRYRLERAPRTPVLVRASSYGIPAATTDDYARLAAYQPDSTAPVLLDHAQYVRFMSELVDALWQALGAETRVFVRFRMPYNGALPANLLDPRVLIGSGLDTQMAFWSRVERSRASASSTGFAAISITRATTRSRSRARASAGSTRWKPRCCATGRATRSASRAPPTPPTPPANPRGRPPASPNRPWKPLCNRTKTPPAASAGRCPSTR